MNLDLSADGDRPCAPSPRVRRRDLPRDAVLQVCEPYRLEASAGVVYWDVIWIGPLDRLFTRLRVEPPVEALKRFLVVHREVSSLRPEGLPPRSSRFARHRGFRIYGDVPMRTAELGDLLAAMSQVRMAVLGVEPSVVWSLVYEVRFEPDQLARCLWIAQNVIGGGARPYR